MIKPATGSFAWQGRRCLVTGARGFIGSALCAELRRAGAEVHGLSRENGAPDLVDQWHTGDVADEAIVQAAFSAVRPDTVFHLAATVSGSRDIALVMPTLRGILGGTVNVLLAAAANRSRRVVCLGSLQEPDDQIRGAPPSPYAAAKFAASAYARMFCEVFAVPVSIGRPFMAYGAGQTDMTKVVPHVASKVLNGGSAELSSGRQAFDWVYVDDVVAALLAIASRDETIGATVDIGCGVLTPVREVAMGIARRVGRPEALHFGALPDRKLEPTRCADVEAAARLTGWRPRVTLEQGLDLALQWYRRHL